MLNFSTQDCLKDNFCKTDVVLNGSPDITSVDLFVGIRFVHAKGG